MTATAIRAIQTQAAATPDRDVEWAVLEVAAQLAEANEIAKLRLRAEYAVSDKAQAEVREAIERL